MQKYDTNFYISIQMNYISIKNLHIFNPYKIHTIIKTRLKNYTIINYAITIVLIHVNCTSLM